MSITPCGSLLFTASYDMHLKEFSIDQHSMPESKDYGPIHERTISCMIISPCGTTLYTSSGDKHIKEICIKEHAVRHDWGECHQSTIKSIAVTPCGNFLFTGGYQSHLKQWNTQTRECVKDFENAHDWPHPLFRQKIGTITWIFHDKSTINPHLFSLFAGKPR